VRFKTLAHSSINEYTDGAGIKGALDVDAKGGTVAEKLKD